LFIFASETLTGVCVLDLDFDCATAPGAVSRVLAAAISEIPVKGNFIIFMCVRLEQLKIQ
jgi:hypothetical protein